MTPPDDAAPTPAHSNLDDAAIEALVHGRHGDPFSVLGRHRSELRCLAPSAEGVEAISDNGDVARLRRRHPAGFFVGEIPADKTYRLRIHWSGEIGRAHV